MHLSEIKIWLNGELYTLCPTFDALHRIEKKLDTGMVALARKFANEAATLEEMAVVLEECLKEKIAVREHIVKSGVAHVIERISTMFAEVFGGHSLAAHEPPAQQDVSAPAGSEPTP